MKVKTAFTLSVLLFLGATTSASAINFDEAVDGDFSNDAGNPTAIGTLDVGLNTIAGSIINSDESPNNGDSDFLTFTVPQGTQLTALLQQSYPSGDPGFQFLAVGTSTTDPLVIQDDDNLDPTDFYIGGALIETLSPGSDMLPDLAASTSIRGIVPGSGFTIPLDAGDYVYGLQQTTDIKNPYVVSFQVTPVPFETEGTMGLVAFGGYLWLRNRKQRS